MRTLAILSLSLIAWGALAAGAPVEELPSRGGGYPSTSVQPQPATSGADLYSELQALRDEVRELRGIIEEQGNELRQLRQQQMDDYQDLDRRLGGRDATSDETERAPGSASKPSLVETGDQGQTSAKDEEARYTATYKLLPHKIDEAMKGFKELVTLYPNGKYTANAYYWLGEIYLLQNDLKAAEGAFSTVVERFPAHRKGNDATFKLAKVYHLQGRNPQSKELLQRVAKTNSSAAALAQAYLRDNF